MLLKKLSKNEFVRGAAALCKPKKNVTQAKIIVHRNEVILQRWFCTTLHRIAYYYLKKAGAAMRSKKTGLLLIPC